MKCTKDITIESVQDKTIMKGMGHVLYYGETGTEVRREIIFLGTRRLWDTRNRIMTLICTRNRRKTWRENEESN